MTDNTVILITGGSAGIGAAAARQLLGQGYRVAVTGRDRDRLARLTADLGHPAGLLALPGDAADYSDVEHAVTGTLRRFGRLDAVVASAGFATVGNLADGDPEQWREMILTNVLGPALLIKAAVPALRETRGRIVLIGSTVGLTYSRGNLYGATKWAVTALAENARLMLTADGVGVTLVNPGRVRTPFWDPHGGFPEGEMLSADEVASAVVWALGQPPGVDVSTITVRPAGQPS